MPIPNTLERKALKKLAGSPWEYPAQLYVGRTTIASLFEKGWIEEMPPVPSGQRRVRITTAGEAALKTLASEPVKKKRTLSMLKPRIAALDMRTAKPVK
ncbi:MAG: hypothetical protein QJR07_11370 [Acetobacteraceae bacterium]|nr:hypothetical protein [Acetobacteraceae bacterium]